MPCIYTNLFQVFFTYKSQMHPFEPLSIEKNKWLELERTLKPSQFNPLAVCRVATH